MCNVYACCLVNAFSSSYIIDRWYLHNFEYIFSSDNSTNNCKNIPHDRPPRPRSERKRGSQSRQLMLPLLWQCAKIICATSTRSSIYNWIARSIQDHTEPIQFKLIDKYQHMRSRVNKGNRNNNNDDDDFDSKCLQSLCLAMSHCHTHQLPATSHMAVNAIPRVCAFISFLSFSLFALHNINAHDCYGHKSEMWRRCVIVRQFECSIHTKDQTPSDKICCVSRSQFWTIWFLLLFIHRCRPAATIEKWKRFLFIVYTTNAYS